MVAKISTGGNMFGALAYNQNKVDSGEAKVLFSNRMLLSEDGNFSIGECMRSFEMQMPVQLSTKKPILHISINPHPEDVLTDQQLSDIAKEYMRKLGYGDQPYLVYKHTDIDRHHIHIVGLRVDENGKPLNDKFEHRRSKQITRELEKKYGLHPAERKERAERPELNKVDSEDAKVLFSNKMLLSEDGNFSIGECMRSFEMQMPVQLSTKKPILHISINPHPEDKLSDSQLSDIAQEYMRKLGYGDQPYLVYKHTDIDRHHIHIVGLRVDESGKPLNDRFEHRRSKQITRELEKKYNLHPAERKERAERPELKKVDYAAGDVKHQIGNTVKAACYGYRFQSFGEYKALLAAYNVCAEEVKGEVNGKPYQGIVYSATNDKGEKAGNPVKASRIGKSVGYEAVQRRMEKSGEAIKNGKLKERTRKIVATAMQTARSRKELEQQLRKRGIDVVFRQNDSGRIYGVTFIDHDSRVVLNGSRLGKEYSANVFNERFSGETGKIHQPEVAAPQQDQPTHQEQQGFTPKADIVSGVASVLGAFGGLLGGGASGGDEPQDTARQKRKKKKKRTRRID